MNATEYDQIDLAYVHRLEAELDCELHRLKRENSELQDRCLKYQIDHGKLRELLGQMRDQFQALQPDAFRLDRVCATCMATIDIALRGSRPSYEETS